MTSSKLRQPAPRTSFPTQPSTNDSNSSRSAVPPNTPVVYKGPREGRRRGMEQGSAGRDDEAARMQTDRRTVEDGARRRHRAGVEQPGVQSPRLFLAPPKTPSDTRPPTSQLPRRAQPQQTSRAHVVRSGSIRKRTSVRRPGGPPRTGGEKRHAGGSNVGQVGSSTHSQSRIPAPPLPLTGRERLRPSSYHAPPDASRRARGPILEPPASYHSHDRPAHGSLASNLPRRRPSLRCRLAGPRATTTPHSSPRLPSSSFVKRPPLPHLSSSESLLRVKMPTSRPTALGLTHRPKGRDCAPRMDAERQSSASSSGPDEAKLLWAELGRRLAPEDVGPNDYDDDLEDGWSKEWVRNRERQRDHGAGVSLASLALDEARRIASSDEDRDTLLRPPSYPSGGSYETAAQWSPLATVGSPRASPLHLSGSLSPLPPHSPCPQMAHPSPRALPGLRSPLLDPTYTCPSPIGMQRLDSHVAKAMHGLEQVWTGGGSPLMLGRPLAGLWDEDEVEDGKETSEEGEGNERELARRLVWNESYRRTGRWRASVSAMAGVTREKNTTSKGLERDLSSAVPDLEADEVEDVAEKEANLDLDVKFIGLGLVDEDTTTALLPSLGFGTNPNPRSRLSTLTNSNSEESSSASSSRTNSSLGVPPAISTRSSSLTSSASASSSADRIKSPLLPICPETSSPHIPESPLLSLPTPDLSLAPASPAPGGLRPLSLPIKYNLAPASPVVAGFETKRASLGAGTGVGSRRVSGGGAANRGWRVMGGEMGEGEGAEVRMWK